MELIFMNHDGTEEVTRCDINDDTFQRLEEQAQERGVTVEEQILHALTTALEEDERRHQWDVAWEHSTKAEIADQSIKVEEIDADAAVNQEDEGEAQR